ncbi:hypothetical protein HOU08_gp317 [Dickeya phage vB_DsoM_JA29]|uniref:Uncharacterized protein n=1 Tax=Dickeya phage vB_DsoM_JA29 TaxID=2283031 RepID=A0A384ZXP4_9CAUD|nr:hypothetical protein HOU08_gp317 [Dickeya phage vB_DsoM_JA29]AXG67043.1 hypothetical protein JA29_317 [Dickeya phage vB_DsoM_JA29]
MKQDSLSKFIETKLLIKRNSSAFRVVYAATVRYLACGFKSIAEYHSILQKYVDFNQFEFSAADFRIQVGSVCRFVTNIRFYALSICLAKQDNLKRVVLSYKKFGVRRRDAQLIWKLMLADIRCRKMLLKTAKQKHKTLCAAQVNHHELQLRMNQINELTEVLNKNIKSRVKKQLRWVMTAHNITWQDIVCDVTCKLIVSYYNSLPNAYSFQHQLNYLRRSLENIIHNMNHYYAADCRKRMQKSGDGFELIVMSDNQLNRNVGLGDSENERSYEDLAEPTSAPVEQLETNIAIERLLAKNAGKKRGKLYSVVLGRDEHGFSEYLAHNNLLGKRLSNGTEWLVAKPIATVRKVLAKWLNVSVEAVESGLNTLRTALQIA